jgi:hypothetical protein
MVAEIFGGISALKASLDILKTIKDTTDVAARQAIVIKLHEQILAAQEAQLSLIEQVHTLKADVAKFEAWDAEKQNYELKDLGSGALAYMLKPDARSGEPPHWICTNCYGNQRISIIQHTSHKHGGMAFLCQACLGTISPSSETFDGGGYKWLD